MVIVTISRVSHVDTLEGRAFESRGRCVMAIWIDRGDIPLRNFRDSRYSPYLGGVMSVSRYLALSDVVIALGG